MRFDGIDWLHLVLFAAGAVGWAGAVIWHWAAHRRLGRNRDVLLGIVIFVTPLIAMVVGLLLGRMIVGWFPGG